MTRYLANCLQQLWTINHQSLKAGYIPCWSCLKSCRRWLVPDISIYLPNLEKRIHLVAIIHQVYNLIITRSSWGGLLIPTHGTDGEIRQIRLPPIWGTPIMLLLKSPSHWIVNVTGEPLSVAVQDIHMFCFVKCSISRLCHFAVQSSSLEIPLCPIKILGIHDCLVVDLPLWPYKAIKETKTW